MPTGEDIVEYARTWIGARWRHQGRGIGSKRGIDCAGLLIRTAQNFDLPHGDMLGYSRQPSPDFLKHVQSHSLPGDRHNIINGSIGIFNDTIMPCHVGIFAVDETTGNISVIHSECYPKNCVNEAPYTSPLTKLQGSLKSRLVDVRLFKGVDYVN